MESWNHIINTALIGTDKRTIKKEDFAGALAENTDFIYQPETDKEDQFLQLASVVYNYRQCGVLPVHNETLSLAKAGKEEKKYCSPFAHSVLNDLLQVDSKPLLELWFNECIKKEMIVQPEMVPLLFDTASRHRQLQNEIVLCTGKRGIWLMQFNEDWNWTVATNEEELWQTGTLDQRKKILAQIRNADPAKGRELLQQVWQQENASSKTDLVQQLADQGGAEDLDWLEELLKNEKSTKVKDEILKILKTIPSSAIVQKYWNVLKQSVLINRSRGLLGIGKKEELIIKLVEVDKDIFKTGVHQTSSEKNANDESFILYQLIGLVPPDLWEAHFEMNSKNIIELFLKDEQFVSLVGAFGLAASRFKNYEWLRSVISLHKNSIHIDAFKLLPQNEAESYALQFLSNDDGASSVLHVIYFFSEEWGMEFAKAVLKYTANNPYQYNKTFYNQTAHLLPISIINDLEKFTPKDEQFRDSWMKNSEHIIRLLTLKTQTLQSFQS